MTNTFWDDFAQRTQDPTFARAYAVESARIAMIDAVVNALDEARAAVGITKADLARAIGTDPATVRRLFSAAGANPTLGTVVDLATALGLRICVQPMSPDDKAMLAAAVCGPREQAPHPRRRSSKAA